MYLQYIYSGVEKLVFWSQIALVELLALLPLSCLDLSFLGGERRISKSSPPLHFSFKVNEIRCTGA